MQFIILSTWTFNNKDYHWRSLKQVTIFLLIEKEIVLNESIASGVLVFVVVVQECTIPINWSKAKSGSRFSHTL